VKAIKRSLLDNMKADNENIKKFRQQRPQPSHKDSHCVRVISDKDNSCQNLSFMAVYIY
jgi:hypothetical protein